MPARSRTKLTLGLAVASLAASATTAAENSQDMGWSCTMNRDGEWRCDSDTATLTSAATHQQQEATNAAPASSKAVSAENATSVANQTVADTVVSDSPAAKAVSLATTKHSSPVKKTADIVTKSSAVSTPSATPATRSNQASTAQVTALSAQVQDNDSWQCRTGSQGNWDCSGPDEHATSDNATTPQQNQENPWSDLDWVQNGLTGGLCRGYYQAPVINASSTDNNAPLLLEAAQSSTQLGGLTRLEGGVEVQQGQRLLRADYAEFDQVTNKATLQGGVSLREPGLLLRGDTAQADINTTQMVFTDARYVLHEQALRGQADKVLRLQDGRLRLENSSYTFCPPGVETWQLSADSIMLDKEKGYGSARDATLKIAGVPVIYVPWFTFPIDDTRRSGFLYPTLSASSDNGFELGVPYYFNLADNYDDTLTPHVITERGLMLDNEFRYLNRWSHNVLSTSILPDDKKRDEHRWLLGVQSTTYNLARWRGEIDFTRVSDTDYFSDLDSNLEVRRQDHLDQRAEISYQGDNWLALARLHSYQTLSDDQSPYRRMPQLWLQGVERWNQVQLDYQSEYVDFDRDLTSLSGADRIIGQRIHLMPSLSYQYRQSWGYAVPTARLWSTRYQLDNQLAGADSTPTINVPIFSLDSGLFFDRQMAGGGTQTLEPRLFALFVDEENQDALPDFDTSELDFDYRSLFRFNRFSGRDRIGDSRQVSLGLTSRWIHENGYEQARFSIGQAYYFADRNVQLAGGTQATTDHSDIATETVWNINQQWRTTLDMIFDEQLDISKSNLKFSYRRDLDHRFNVSYRFEEAQRKQLDSSFIWPVSPQWHLLGRWQQDLENSKTLEALLGVEYESCCWRTRLSLRRWLDNADNTDNAVYLQFYLKGLGNIGSGGGSTLNDIIGYQEREEHKEEQK
ncbi:MAG: LPS assembly protein LptD [Marinobacterium sp.]|nr:LPS assembly protein LptD [Marinobacterium sp.]